MRILIAEGCPGMLHNLSVGMEEEGYKVDKAHDGAEAIYCLSNWEYDGVVLDVMMLECEGLTVLGKIRKLGVRTPVLLLSVKDTSEDIVAGLNAGADAYLVKPFNYNELVARVRAMLRRSAGFGSNIISAGTTQIDIMSKEVRVDGVCLILAKQEYLILLALVMYKGRVLSRPFLLDQINNDQGEVNSNLLDVLIHTIRKKVGGNLIKTRRGEGFIIDAQ